MYGMVELARNTLTRMTFEPRDNDQPAWNSTGTHIYFWIQTGRDAQHLCQSGWGHGADRVVLANRWDVYER